MDKLKLVLVKNNKTAKLFIKLVLPDSMGVVDGPEEKWKHLELSHNNRPIHTAL